MQDLNITLADPVICFAGVGGGGGVIIFSWQAKQKKTTKGISSRQNELTSKKKRSSLTGGGGGGGLKTINIIGSNLSAGGGGGMCLFCPPPPATHPLWIHQCISHENTCICDHSDPWALQHHQNVTIKLTDQYVSSPVAPKKVVDIPLPQNPLSWLLQPYCIAHKVASGK